MRKKTLNRKEKDILIEKISDFLKTKKYILFAYIFGSFIIEDSFSDIDIGIFIKNKNFKSPLEVELKLEREIENIAHVPVDVRIINHAPLSFIYSILKNRIVIVDNNKSLRADFEGLVYKKYFDFRYLRDEYLREIINAPL